MRKKGQEFGTAHILILVITIFLVLYILFLPEEARQELLGDAPGLNITGTDTGYDGILTKNIGQLEYYQPGFDHVIPSTFIFEARNAEALKEVNPFVVKKGWFTSKTERIEFIIDDLENTDNVQLAFDADERAGTLWVKLNGEIVYEFEPKGVVVEPIQLRNDLLQKVNTLEIGVAGVGLQFWKVNAYILRNVKVIGDITDVEKQKSENVFVLSPTEKNNLISARLKFLPQCDPTQTGVLYISINGKRIFAGTPDCEILNQQEISANDLQVDTNTLMFETQKGNYRIDAPTITTNLREVRTFVEYFNIEQKLFDEVIRGDKKLFLEIDFIDDGKRKRAELNINGRPTFIDQVEPFYTRNLEAVVLPGAKNYIEIIPETTLNIPELRVVVR